MRIPRFRICSGSRHAKGEVILPLDVWVAAHTLREIEQDPMSLLDQISLRYYAILLLAKCPTARIRSRDACSMPDADSPPVFILGLNRTSIARPQNHHYQGPTKASIPQQFTEVACLKPVHKRWLYISVNRLTCLADHVRQHARLGGTDLHGRGGGF